MVTIGGLAKALTFILVAFFLLACFTVLELQPLIEILMFLTIQRKVFGLVL
jgi:hypothetical protein